MKLSLEINSILDMAMLNNIIDMWKDKWAKDAEDIDDDDDAEDESCDCCDDEAEEDDADDTEEKAEDEAISKLLHALGYRFIVINGDHIRFSK